MIKYIVLLILMVTSYRSFGGYNGSLEVKSGAASLEFSGEKDGIFNELKYKTADQQVLDIFDQGLGFDYRPGRDNYLSADGKYFFVNFVAYGEQGEGSSTGEADENMCGFVRMKDGCVVRVDPGSSAICGGEWNKNSQWISEGHPANNLDLVNTSAAKLFDDYSRGKATGSSRGTHVQDYAMNGTAFGNLLACDPINSSNTKSYKGLLKALQAEGDKLHADEIQVRLHKLGQD